MTMTYDQALEWLASQGWVMERVTIWAGGLKFTKEIVNPKVADKIVRVRRCWGCVQVIEFACSLRYPQPEEARP